MCGWQGLLSDEHVPPRSAFNDHAILEQRMNTDRPRKQQGGHRRPVLCVPCNNKTGSWYGGEYVRFVRQCAEYATPAAVNSKVVVPLGNISPLRVLKQALTIMAASCGDGLTQRNLDIRRLILDKDQCHLPPGIHLCCYLKPHRSTGRSTGMTSQLNTLTNELRVSAEFAWWPLGWILSFGPLPPDLATDVTHWSQYGFADKPLLEVTLPCQWTFTPYPLDFRSPDEVARDASLGAGDDPRFR